VVSKPAPAPDITLDRQLIPFVLKIALNLFVNYNRINEWPLQFLRTGNYRRSYGYLAYRMEGVWWSGTVGSAIYGRRLGTSTGYVHAQNDNWRGLGFARCCGGRWPRHVVSSGVFRAVLRPGIIKSL